jgi:hypothetical protein
MAYGNQFKSAELGGSGFSATYSYEAYPLGTIAVESADEVAAATHTDGTALGLKGDRVWMFVRAKSTLTIYDCCIVDTADTATVSFEVIPSDTAGDNALDVVGVAQNAFTDEYYGWVVVAGECVVNAAAGVTAGLFIDTHSGGQVDDSTAAGTLIGKALSATGTPVSGTIRARIRLP